MNKGSQLLMVMLTISASPSFAEENLSAQSLNTFQNIETKARQNSAKPAKTRKIEIRRDEHDTGLEPFEARSEKSGVSIKIEKYRENIPELNTRAYRALMMGQIEAAVAIYKKALIVDAKNQTALFGLAAAYQKSGQADHARKIYDRLLELYPSNQEATNNFLALAGEESPREALLQMKRLDAANPNSSPVAAQIGMLHHQLQENEQAIGYLRRAVSLSPESPVYRYNLAVILDQMGNKASATELYRSLLDDHYKGVPIPGSVQQIQDRLIFLGTK